MAELLYIDWRYEDMIKVIASDMDGTLLCDDHRIAPDTIAGSKGSVCGRHPVYGGDRQRL